MTFDSHSCSEKHRYPRKKRVSRFTVIASQFDVAVFAQHQINQKNHKYGYRPDVNPIQIYKYELLDYIEHFFCQIGMNCSYETDDGNKNNTWNGNSFFSVVLNRGEWIIKWFYCAKLQRNKLSSLRNHKQKKLQSINYQLFKNKKK